MATEKLQVYKCNVCQIVVEVLDGGAGTLVCCGEPMALLKENTTDASKEKHVPVVQKTPEGLLVQVGSVPHPMEAKHFIQWIEIVVDGRMHRQFLSPGDKPQALFRVDAQNVVVREMCNLHGLWKA